MLAEVASVRRGGTPPAPISRTPAPLARAGIVAALVVAVDAASKVVAVAALNGRTVPLGDMLHLTTVYNDTFARGMELGGFTTAAACGLAAVVALLAGRACAPLAAHDAAAPTALGLVGGAALGNAADFLRTGRGAVDFLGIPTADGAIVFNLADVAAYVGTALLARTAFLLARAIARGEARPAPVHAPSLARAAERLVERPAERHVELPVAVPLFAHADARPGAGAPHAALDDEAPPPAPRPAAPLGDAAG